MFKRPTPRDILIIEVDRSTDVYLGPADRSAHRLGEQRFYVGLGDHVVLEADIEGLREIAARIGLVAGQLEMEHMSEQIRLGREQAERLERGL